MARNKKILAGFIFGILAIISILVWIKPSDSYSYSERRPLEQFPELTLENVLSGTFMKDFESYATDQFPFRDKLRMVKTILSTKIFGQKDVHGLYCIDGYMSKIEYPLNEYGVDRALNRIGYLYDKYMKNTDMSVYYALIPDKNYYLAEANGYLSMDYEVLFERVHESLNQAQNNADSENDIKEIRLTDFLNIEDYYRTDIHWRQENLLDVSKHILKTMGNEANAEYELQRLDAPFYGVYASQFAMPVEAETIFYYTNEILDHSIVYDYQNNINTTVYDMEKAYGRDPYELFLSGSLSLMTVENPIAETDKELILFRDSFGSSMAPLLVESYKKITLVDIRYIHPDLLEKYIDFKDQDVLFLYSTSVLNNGEIFK